MLVLLQSSDPNHLANMAESMELRGDTVHTAATLPELQDLALTLQADGHVMDLSPESIAWWQAHQAANPAARAVFLTPRENLGQALGQYPGVSLLPMPGTAMAIRCLLTPNPAEDPVCTLGDYQLLELEALGRRTFYDPPDRGFEREIRKRLDYWAKLRKDRSS